MFYPSDSSVCICVQQIATDIVTQVIETLGTLEEPLWDCVPTWNSLNTLSINQTMFAVPLQGHSVALFYPCLYNRQPHRHFNAFFRHVRRCCPGKGSSSLEKDSQSESTTLHTLNSVIAFGKVALHIYGISVNMCFLVETHHWNIPFYIPKAHLT